jgi:hypothetical protein
VTDTLTTETTHGRTSATEWSVPDTVQGLQQELAARPEHGPLQREATLSLLSHPMLILGAGASIAPMRVRPADVTPMPRDTEQVAIEVETGPRPTRMREGTSNAAQLRTADGRFVVDPNAMSQLVDWAMDQDFGPDAGEEIRRDAWH